MTLAAGVHKTLAIKKETTWGEPAGASGAAYVRRTESTLSLEKDTYESNEIRSDRQVADFRHGVRRVKGAINGELSLGDYAPLIAAALRRDFTAGGAFTASGGEGVTADAASRTFTRAGGSWIDDGFRVGQVVRFTGLSAPGDNGVNLRIVALSAAAMQVAEPISDEASPNEACTCAVAGKLSFIPRDGHTADSFTLEHAFTDIDVAEVFTGCRVGSMKLSLPATGIATVSFDLQGKDMTVAADGDAPYFADPVPAGSGAVLAAVNGSIRLGGKDLAVVTGVEITLDLGLSGEPVAGTNTVSELFHGRSRVSGQITAYFEDESLVSAFSDEDELELHLMITDTDSPAGFVSLFLPRVKLGGASKGDGEAGIVQTLPFTALLKDTADGYESSTLIIQDSSL